MSKWVYETVDETDFHEYDFITQNIKTKYKQRIIIEISQTVTKVLFQIKFDSC